MLDLEPIRARAEKATRKPIPGYEGYEADTEGHIWSVASNWRNYGHRKLREDTNPLGYLKVRLYRQGKRVRKSVHHLVALAYCGLPSANQQACHSNGDKSNNCPNNIRWGSAKDNAKDRERHGNNAKGSRNGQAKLTEGDVLLIKAALRAGSVQRFLAIRYDVTPTAIRLIKQGRTWRHVT